MKTLETIALEDLDMFTKGNFAVSTLAALH